MIIPYGHENTEVRRLPWVSIVIMSLCVLVYLGTYSAISRWEAEAEKAFRQFFTYYMTHPYLELSPQFKKLFTNQQESEDGTVEESEEGVLAEEIFDAFNKYGEDAEQPDEYVIEEEQQKLDGLAARLADVIETNPYHKWGFIPTKKTFGGLIFHMFVHGGFWHLIGNLFLFYLCGPFIEDAWGRLTFGAFYMICGFAAALMYAVHYPNFSGPLIGASGAISGVMGAFLIRYYNVRIKFLFFLTFLFSGTFKAPAWLMLPMWLLGQYLSAKLMDSFSSYGDGGGGGGVAYWAHIWGFLFGVGLAFLVKYLKVEEKYVTPKIEAETSFVDKGRVAYEEAMELFNNGDSQNGFIKLKEAASHSPGDQEIVETLWNAGLELGKQNQAAPFMLRLMEKELRGGELEYALYHYTQLRDKLPEVPLDLQSRVKLFEAIINAGELNDAKSLYDELFEKIDLSAPPGLLLEFCTAVLKYDNRFDQAIAPDIINRALRHPDVPGLKKEELKGMLYQNPLKPQTIKINPPASAVDPVITPGSAVAAGAAMAAAGAAAPAAPAQPPPIPARESDSQFEIYHSSTPPPLPKSLKITSAVPLAIADGKLILKVENVGQRAFSLKRIEFVSVVKITPESDRPFLLIDLFMANPRTESLEIRTVRMLSSQFNPKIFAPEASSAMDAFKSFIASIMDVSGAQPYPDLESVQLKKMVSFGTILDYEESVLG
jgi:membrane associated rhomboid family serine protease